MSHFVVGASQFEAKDREKIFTFEVNLSLETIAEVDGMGEWGLLEDIVDS